MDVKFLGASLDIDAATTTVGLTATLLPAFPMALRRSLYIFNNAAAGGTVLYVGGNDVTTAAGMPIPPQTSLALDISAIIGGGNPPTTASVGAAGIYGIVSTGTVDCRTLEIG